MTIELKIVKFRTRMIFQNYDYFFPKKLEVDLKYWMEPNFYQSATIKNTFKHA